MNYPKETATKRDPFDVAAFKILKRLEEKKPKPLEGVTFEQAKEGLLKIISVSIPNIKISKENKPTYLELVKYFINDPSCNLDLTKGIFLYGPTGTGKTSLMRAFAQFTGVTRLKQFTIKSTKELPMDVLTYGISEVYEPLRKSYSPYGKYENAICFDDVGHEGECNSFGTKLNPVEDILTFRYNKGILTHATSNVKPDQIKEHYGGRIESRVYEMFNFVKLIGKDNRN